MKNSVTQADVDAYVGKIEYQKLGEKTTLAFATLKNGFELAVTSGCVDAKNYNQAMGEAICEKRLKDKVWELLGFELQCRLHDEQTELDFHEMLGQGV